MHNTGYKSALARRACRYSDTRPPRKADGVLLESELPPHMRGKVSFPSYGIAFGRDHPRVCGEKRFWIWKACRSWGLPPRMRGKVTGLEVDREAVGITPAYAGKRNAQRLGASGSRDHPRICGEKTSPSITPPKILGSPPRMRGKGRAARLHHLIDGITPAYAGKRLWCRGHGAPGQDYPRICGEKMDNAVCDFYFFGSPPHMRGKVGAVVQLRAGAGITPAYAGKSCA